MLLYYRESSNIGGGVEFDNSIPFNEYALELMLENEREWNSVQREIYTLNESDGDKTKKKNIFINFIKKIINKIRELYDKLISFIKNSLSKLKRNKTKIPQETTTQQTDTSVKNNDKNDGNESTNKDNNDESINKEREELLNRRNERKLLMKSFLAGEPFDRKSKIDEREIFELGVKNIDEEYIGYDIDLDYINNILHAMTQTITSQFGGRDLIIRPGNRDYGRFMKLFLSSISGNSSTYKVEWVNDSTLVKEFERNIYGMEHDLFKNPNYTTYDKMESRYYNMYHLSRMITIDRDSMTSSLTRVVKKLSDSNVEDYYISDIKEIIDLCLDVTAACLKAVPILIRNTTIVYDRIIRKGVQVYIETD